MYNDGGQYWDEHAFASAWLYKATGEKKYLVRELVGVVVCDWLSEL
jgi:hypothetical protein